MAAGPSNPFVHATLSVPPGLEDVRTGAAGNGSGSNTPDFLSAWARPSSYSGDDFQQLAGIATPRDDGRVAKISVERLSSKLQHVKMQEYGLAPTSPAAPTAPFQATQSWGAAPPPPTGFARPLRRTSKAGFIASMGTVGHPTQCAAMCFSEVCTLGAACPRCHLCRVQWEAAEEEKRQVEAQRSGAGGVLSIGSIGHPTTCAGGCKFHTKPKGCKDGNNCTFCHLCRWMRHSRDPTKPRRSPGIAEDAREG